MAILSFSVKLIFVEEEDELFIEKLPIKNMPSGNQKIG
jgi:hypothetical protein